MAENTLPPQPTPAPAPQPAAKPRRADRSDPPLPTPEPELGGPQGPEPTRYGDWERGGRCIDF